VTALDIVPEHLLPRLPLSTILYTLAFQRTIALKEIVDHLQSQQRQLPVPQTPFRGRGGGGGGVRLGTGGDGKEVEDVRDENDVKGRSGESY
jgi:hypothetical protein